MIYDERQFIEAFVFAQRPLGPKRKAFYVARLRALEEAFGVRIEESSLPSSARILAILFYSAADSCANLDGPRAGMLEDGLLNMTIEEQAPELFAIEKRLSETLRECRERHLDLLLALYRRIWPSLKPVSSEDLAAAGFDDNPPPFFIDDLD